METDLKGTVKEIQKIGYEDLETYGFDPEGVKFYGMKARDFRTFLDDHQLTTSSGHYDLFRFFDKPVDELIRYVDQCVEGADAVGHRYITWPWLTPESRAIEKFGQLAERLNVIGERVTRAGLGFAYHNHDFEFTNHDGRTGYEIIMRETDPDFVKLQIDLYWVMHSSRLTPAELFDRQPGRFVMWHIKDMHKVSRDYTELGNGSIDYGSILPLAERAGMELFFLEQGGNFAVNPMQSIADSARFFKSRLEKFL
jgi:sugar phosphate isomerase/epimerase